MKRIVILVLSIVFLECVSFGSDGLEHLLKIADTLEYYLKSDSNVLPKDCQTEYVTKNAASITLCGVESKAGENEFYLSVYPNIGRGDLWIMKFDSEKKELVEIIPILRKDSEKSASAAPNKSKGAHLSPDIAQTLKSAIIAADAYYAQNLRERDFCKDLWIISMVDRQNKIEMYFHNSGGRFYYDIKSKEIRTSNDWGLRCDKKMFKTCVNNFDIMGALESAERYFADAKINPNDWFAFSAVIIIFGSKDIQSVACELGIKPNSYGENEKLLQITLLEKSDVENAEIYFFDLHDTKVNLIKVVHRRVKGRCVSANVIRKSSGSIFGLIKSQYSLLKGYFDEKYGRNNLWSELLKESKQIYFNKEDIVFCDSAPGEFTLGGGAFFKVHVPDNKILETSIYK